VFSEFKKFVLRGNVVDLAVAVVIGASFNAVVQTLVSSFITPLIAAVGGQPDFSKLYFIVHNSRFNYGIFLNAVVSFLILAAVVFFLVVTPINKLNELSQRSKKTDDPTTKKCPECLSEIPLKATRCPFCTSKLVAGQ
jgi:large conductance mechanosensitive channel